MATVTVSTDQNFDDLTFSTSDSITVNSSATCTYDSHSLGHGLLINLITVSLGTFHIDGTGTRELDYDGGDNAGGDPAVGETVTGGTSSATGVIILVESTTTGVAGRLQLKSVSGQFQDNENLTFSTCTSTMVANALHASTGTVTTANGAGTTLIDSAATFYSDGVAEGDYVLNTTDGSVARVVSVDSTTQLTTEVLTGGTDNDYDSSDAYEIAADTVGWLMIVGQAGGRIYPYLTSTFSSEGAWKSLGRGDGTASQTLTHYTDDGLPAVWVETSAGSGEYEIWLNVGVEALTDVSVNEFGKFFKHDGTSSTITFGDGTNGDVLPNNCNVRVPNIVMATSNATQWGIDQGRIIGVNGTTNCWYFQQNVQPGNVSLKKTISSDIGTTFMSYRNLLIHDCALSRYLTATSIVENLDIDGVGICPRLTATPTAIASFSLTNVNGTINNVRAVFDGDIASNMSQLYSCTVTGLSLHALNKASAYTGCVNITYSGNSTLTGLVFSGGRIDIEDNVSCTFTDLVHSAKTNGAAPTINQQQWQLYSNSNCTFDGFNQTSDCSYSTGNFISIQRSLNNKLQNIGSSSTPVDKSTTTGALVYVASPANSGLRIARAYIDTTNNGLSVVDYTASDLEMLNCDFGTGNIAPNALGVQPRGIRAGSTYTNVLVNSSLDAFGYHVCDFFFSDTTGAMAILGSPTRTGDAVSEASMTLSGSAYSDDNTRVYFPTATASCIWEWQWDVLGHTGFTDADFDHVSGNIDNMRLEYQIDTGSGYGTNGNGVGAWDYVYDGDHTHASANGNNLSNETISASAGFKLKVRVTCTTASSTNYINAVFLNTTSTSAAQTTNLYPLDVVTLSITGLLSGTEVRLHEDDGSGGLGTEVGGIESSSTSLDIEYEYTTTKDAHLVLIKPGYEYQRISGFQLLATDQTLPVAQRLDRGYNNPA